MKKYLHLAAVGLLCFALVLAPNSFNAQGNGKNNGKNDKHGQNGSKGGKTKIKIDFDKKGNGGNAGHGNKHFDKPGHGNNKHFGHPGNNPYKGFGHPGRGHAYGKYKWHPSPNIVKARYRHRELLGVTIALVGSTALFMNTFHPRLHNSRQKLDIRIKAGGLDIKVKQRREARIKHAEIKAKELDNLLLGAKVKLKIK